MLDVAVDILLAAHHGKIGHPCRGTQRLVVAGVKLGRDSAAQRMLLEGKGHDVVNPCWVTRSCALRRCT